MNPAFTFYEIREIEKNIIEKENIPSLLLMENAGRNSFEVILKNIPHIDEYEIYIVCGKGNNAGDGFTLARHFIINEIPVKTICLEEP
ncbi:MAG: NAD(P)H-hydrate epimerase, partial [Ignavibacteria bacterium]